MKNYQFRLCLTAIAILLLSACDNSKPTKAAQPNTFQSSHIRMTDKSPTATQKQILFIGTKDKPGTLDLHSSSTGSETKILRHIYESLLRIDPNNVDNLIPLLAESWTVAQDNLSITFKIKQNVKFHDGSLLDAETCKLSLNRLLGKEYAAHVTPYLSFYDFIEKINVDDKYTLTIKLTRPVPRVALRNLSLFAAGIISKKMLKATDHMSTDQRSNFITEWASGTGPFYLVHAGISDQRTRLHANPHYHNGKPKIKAIVFSYIPDTNTQIESLKADEIQMLDDPPRQIWDKLENNRNISSVHKWWALSVCYLGINIKHPNTANYNLRRAIRTAIDRKQLKQFYYGTARETYSMIAQPFGEYDPTYRPDADFLHTKQELMPQKNS